MHYPRHDDRAAEAKLRRYLDAARQLLGDPRRLDASAIPAGTVNDDFDHLRW